MRSDYDQGIHDAADAAYVALQECMINEHGVTRAEIEEKGRFIMDHILKLQKQSHASK